MKEMNDRSFKDVKRILEEIKCLFFNTLDLWIYIYIYIYIYISPLVINYHDLCFFLLILIRHFLLYTFYVFEHKVICLFFFAHTN
jgi:hypothetical protein